MRTASARVRGPEARSGGHVSCRAALLWPGLEFSRVLEVGRTVSWQGTAVLDMDSPRAQSYAFMDCQKRGLLYFRNNKEGRCLAHAAAAEAARRLE